MDWLDLVILLAAGGGIIGAVARLLVPGPDPVGFFGTILLGLAGSFLGGIVGRILFGPLDSWPAVAAAVLGAIVLLLPTKALTSTPGRHRNV